MSIAPSATPPRRASPVSTGSGRLCRDASSGASGLRPRMWSAARCPCAAATTTRRLSSSSTRSHEAMYAAGLLDAGGVDAGLAPEERGRELRHQLLLRVALGAEARGGPVSLAREAARVTGGVGELVEERRVVSRARR